MTFNTCQIVGVISLISLGLTQAIRNCHFCGADYVTEAEVDQYCRDFSHVAAINRPKTANTYDELLDMFEVWGTGVAVTHSKVTGVFVRNRTTNCFVENPDTNVLEMGDGLCTLTTPWNVVTFENICILKELDDSVLHEDHEGNKIKLGARMTLISECPYNVSVGDEVIVNLRSVGSRDSNSMREWASVLPESDTEHFNAEKMVWATPTVLDQMVRICKFQSPRAIGWTSKCPKVPDDINAETCDSGTIPLYNNLVFFIFSAMLSLIVLY